MVRKSALRCYVVLAALAATIGATNVARADHRQAVDPIRYNEGQLAFCHGLDRPGHYALNPGRFDNWAGYGPYTHKHYGGQRWHDRNYNGCAPWWQPAPYATAAARRAFRTAADSPHVRWCLERYQSYNPRTDTYVGYDGNAHRCAGPK